MSYRDDGNSLALVVAIASLIISLVLLIANMINNTKIAYYESPRGIIDRALNESKEEEYRVLKTTSKLYYLIGLSAFVIGIGGLGIYVNNKRESKRGEPSYYI